MRVSKGSMIFISILLIIARNTKKSTNRHICEHLSKRIQNAQFTWHICCDRSHRLCLHRIKWPTTTKWAMSFWQLHSCAESLIDIRKPTIICDKLFVKTCWQRCVSFINKPNYYFENHVAGVHTATGIFSLRAFKCRKKKV